MRPLLQREERDTAVFQLRTCFHEATPVDELKMSQPTGNMERQTHAVCWADSGEQSGGVNWSLCLSTAHNIPKKKHMRNKRGKYTIFCVLHFYSFQRSFPCLNLLVHLKPFSASKEEKLMTVLPILPRKFKQTKNQHHNTHAQNKNIKNRFSALPPHQPPSCQCGHALHLSVRHSGGQTASAQSKDNPSIHVLDSIPFLHKDIILAILSSPSCTCFLLNHANQQTACSCSPKTNAQPTWKLLLTTSP